MPGRSAREHLRAMPSPPGGMVIAARLAPIDEQLAEAKAALVRIRNDLREADPFDPRITTLNRAINRLD